MIYVFFVILSIYVFTIILFIYGFDKIETVKTKDLKPKTNFSIIVPFRNEENNFLNLLNSISKLNYPKDLFEIIVVNDNSDDESVVVFEKWKSESAEISSRLFHSVRITDSPKKDAILVAISKIKKDWIITTDADCIVNKNWLLTFDDCIQNSKFEMICGPVSISNQKGFLNYFQFVDLLSLQGTTIGSFGINKPFMCNGANFAYTKNLFLELNGFTGNEKITSGDDVFLLQKAIKFFFEKVAYLKNQDALVFTKPEENWSKLFQQRVRWASKTGSYNNFFGKLVAVIVFVTNLLFVFGFCFGFWGFGFLLLGFGFIIKLVIDLIVINKTSRFFGSKKLILPFFSCLFYPFFCVTVAFYSFFGSFTWKKRSYKN